MSESDGMEEVVNASMRQSLMLASRMAETLARVRQESLRRGQGEQERGNREALARVEAERALARAALAPVEQDKWWKKATLEDVARAHATAEAWKDNDPQALATSEKMHKEVSARYGINTHDVGRDALYLQSGVEAVRAERERQEGIREHHKGMALIAAAQAEDIRARTAALQPQAQQYQVPEDYLQNPQLVQALQAIRDAPSPAVATEREKDLRERMFLIEKDGINGPSIDQLRQETSATFAGTSDDLFQDAAFVASAPRLARNEGAGRERVLGCRQ